MAGRLPYDNLELDEWLCVNEPADIYILGCVLNHVSKIIQVNFLLLSTCSSLVVEGKTTKKKLKY